MPVSIAYPAYTIATALVMSEFFQRCKPATNREPVRSVSFQNLSLLVWIWVPGSQKFKFGFGFGFKARKFSKKKWVLGPGLSWALMVKIPIKLFIKIIYFYSNKNLK
jgi:hypothetical protein